MRLARQFALAAALVGAAVSVQTVSAQSVDFTAVPSGDYVLDPVHGYVNFQYSHLGLSNPVLGFDEFTVSMNLDTADVTKSTINATIDPKSVIAGSDIWKSHLTGDKWFDVGSYPEITFSSTSIEKVDDENLKVMGDLTIKDSTVPVELAVTLNAVMIHPFNEKPVIGLSATGQVLRSDFGMGASAPMVSDEVSLTISAELIQ